MTRKLPDNPSEAEHRYNLARLSIEHPYAVLAFFLAVVVLAVVVVGRSMPRRMMPYVESPLIGIVSMKDGLSAEEMETYFSKPIEERMTDVAGVRYIRSTSQPGFSIVTLQFPYGADMRKALAGVTSLVNTVQSDLPMDGANVNSSWVLPIDPLNLPVLSLAMTGEGWDPVRLRELAENEVVARLKRVSDVQSVVPFGGRKRQLQVIVDKDKLASLGIPITELRDTLDQYNMAAAGGTITGGAREAIARVDTLAQSAAQVADYPLKDVGGRTVYVRDVAQVVDGFREQRSGYEFMDHGKAIPAVEVSVIQDPKASSPKVIAAVNDELKRIERDYPGVHFAVAYDNAHFVNLLFQNMGEELLIAVLLTGLVVLLFLGNVRMTLISLVAIPTSMGAALIGMAAFGYSLNSSTLIGLLLAIGRLVDDSIIDIHAVERHLKMGKPPKEAAVAGIAEVRLSVIASTAVLVAALVPLLLSGGLTQVMFEGLAWPIIFALVASTVVSFTLTALLCATFLRAEDVRRRTRFQKMVLDPFQRTLGRMETGYGRLIRWLLKHRFVNLTRVFATILIGWVFYHFIGGEMMPLADVGQAYGVMEAAPGTSFEETRAKARAIQKIMAKYPEIEKVSTEIGFEPGGTYFSGYAMPQVNAATFMVTLSDKDERKRSIWDVIDGVQREAMATIPGIRRFQIKEMGSDVMATSEAPIQIEVTGPNLEMLDQMGKQVADIARETPGMHQVATSWTMGAPDWEIHVDQARAAELGLTPADVADQAYTAMAGSLTREFYHLPNIRRDTILVRYQENQRQSAQDLGNMWIVGTDGKQAPLKTLATINYRSAPTLIQHDGLKRVNSVLGYYRKDGPPSMDLSMEIVGKAMADVNFPPGYGIQMRGDMTEMMTSFAKLLTGLGLAVIFIFLLLAAQFRGFLQPLQMVFSLPLELSGVFFLLWLNHQTFSTVSLLGIIVLTGMDITAAILLIDQIMRYRRRGIPRDEAIEQACPDRLRPILMTALITIVTMIPIAFFPKAGLDAYSPIGTVVIGGLTIGTVLTLIDIPLMHSYVDDIARWLRRKPRMDGTDAEEPEPALTGGGE